jgi:hypothetical protein
MPAREDFIRRLPDRQGSKTFSKAQIFLIPWLPLHPSVQNPGLDRHLPLIL